MAAYAATVTLDNRKPEDFGTGLTLVTGTLDVTNYNSTLVEITDITSRFRNIYQVVLNSVSDNGFAGVWDTTGKAVKCFYFDYDGVADGAAIEAADDTDAGSFPFVVIGIV